MVRQPWIIAERGFPDCFFIPEMNGGVICQFIEHRLDFDRVDVPGEMIRQSVDQVNKVLVLFVDQRNASREIVVPGEDVKVLTTASCFSAIRLANLTFSRNDGEQDDFTLIASVSHQPAPPD